MLQQICDRFGPGTVQAWFDRWMDRIPLPLTAADREAGFWWELSMRQIETSRTLVFDDDVHARAFFESLLCENMDLGRPENVELLFRRGERRGQPAKILPARGFRTAIDRHCEMVTINVFYKNSRVKQYLNCDMRSHAASGCVERRAGLCRRRSPGQRRKTCPRRDVRAGLLGWQVRSSRESPRVPDPSGGHRRGEGRAGVNASELLLMPR